jgi:hypothetical protein
MTNHNTIEKQERRIARPPKVLVPLIRRDVENAEHAGKMFYIAAGEKLTEAKEGTPRGEWEQWIKDNFEFTAPTASIWMRWWKAETQSRASFDTQEEFRQSTSPARKKNSRRKYREYHAPVDNVLNRAVVAERARDAAKEHELETKLAGQLIKIGYGVLATKLHPDKGGSADAMRRLNKVVKALREVYP